jgi:hypothetical protein
MPKRVPVSREIRMNRAIPRPSSPIVVTRTSKESRREPGAHSHRFTVSRRRGEDVRRARPASFRFRPRVLAANASENRKGCFAALPASPRLAGGKYVVALHPALRGHDLVVVAHPGRVGSVVVLAVTTSR